MIYVVKGEDYTVGLTLSQSSYLANPYYLFVLYKNIDTDRPVFMFNADDISAYPERCNIFTFNLSQDVGEYTYRVYESSSPDPTTIDDTTGIIIEEGLCVIDGEALLTDSIYN